MVHPVQDVQIHGIQQRAPSAKTRKRWRVRWMVDGRAREKAFATSGEANRYRSLLVAAHHRGERFDRDAGEPLSWQPRTDSLQVHAWVRCWVAEQWSEWQPRTRASAVEAMARFVPLLVRSSAAPAPEVLRRYLMDTLGPDGAVVEADPCERWLARWCPKLDELDRALLADVDRRLGLGKDGQALSGWTASRYRKLARACIRRAVELDLLTGDPWPPAPKGRSRRKAVRPQSVVDVRALPDPATMERALAAIPSHQPSSRTYQVMIAVMYYGGLRPSETIMLRPRALQLPDEGWGRIDVVEADISFDQSGEPETGRRTVPIPPVLVTMLRKWIDEHGFAPDELIFRTRTGNRPTASN